MLGLIGVVVRLGLTVGSGWIVILCEVGKNNAGATEEVVDGPGVATGKTASEPVRVTTIDGGKMLGTRLKLAVVVSLENIVTAYTSISEVVIGGKVMVVLDAVMVVCLLPSLSVTVA